MLQSAKKYFNSHEYLQQGIFQQVKENVRVEARKKDNDTGQTHLRNLEFLPIVVDLVQWSIPCSNTEDQRVWLNCHEDKVSRLMWPGIARKNSTFSVTILFRMVPEHYIWNHSSDMGGMKTQAI